LAMKDKLADREQQLSDSKQEKVAADELLAATQQQYEAEVIEQSKAHAEQLAVTQSELEKAKAEQQQLTRELSEQTKRAEKAETQLENEKTKVIDTNELRYQESKKAEQDIANWQSRHDSANDELITVKSSLAACEAVGQQKDKQLEEVNAKNDELHQQIFKLVETRQSMPEVVAKSDNSEEDQATIFDELDNKK